MNGWRTAMETALYGPGGFFMRSEDGPAAHFRTSVHASPLFVGALAKLLLRADESLGRPEHFDVVDVGAGRGELLAALLGLGDRFRLVGVELAPRPPGLDPRIAWRRDIPDGIVGALIATEWLDNVPLDVADAETLRKILVDPATGREQLGPPLDASDRMWTARWWPGRRARAAASSAEAEQSDAGGSAPEEVQGDPAAFPAEAEQNDAEAELGGRVEIGLPRDVAWADAVAKVRRGVALAIDYGHVKGSRPEGGTLAGYRGGRQVEPKPDGSCDVTAHVALDSVAEAGGHPYQMITQREALKALGVDGARPSLDLARTDPAGYLRALSAAGAAAELRDPGGLGGHWWLLHTVGLGGRGTMLG